MIKKVKNIVPWAHIINDLNGKEVVPKFFEKELQEASQKEFKIKKVIRIKDDKLYAKWKRLW